MKIVKITALWCNSCLVMNRIYNVGDILPVFIFMKDGKEVKRLVGEHKKEEFIKAVEKVL